MSDPDYMKWPDADILKQIVFIESSSATHRAEIRYNDSLVAQMQAELEAREFSAYWNAHPELTPLTVGDNLLVTQEYINLASGWEIPYLTPLIGSRCSVTNILRGNKYTWVCLDKKLHDAPISIASNMRAAYLAKYPESEANS